MLDRGGKRSRQLLNQLAMQYSIVAASEPTTSGQLAMR